MNLAWVAALAVFVLVEKVAARGPWPSRIGGAALLVWAVWVASRAGS
jgi:predicted metal-binding membrane protein